jgi:hypothetical protein
MIELVTARYMWAHDLDETGAPVLAGEATMRPVESRAVYATVREALLQAAHNEILEPGMEQRIEKNGTQVAGPNQIKEASKRLRGHRETAGMMVGNVQVMLPTGYDSREELKVVSG